MSVEGVKSWMQFWGWDKGGGTVGSVKRDAHGFVVARHGDEIWLKDVEAAIQADRREYEALRKEDK